MRRAAKRSHTALFTDLLSTCEICCAALFLFSNCLEENKTQTHFNNSKLIMLRIIFLSSFFAIIFLYDYMWLHIFNLTLISSVWLCCYTNSSWPHCWKWKRAALVATYRVSAAATYMSYPRYFLFSGTAFVGKLPVARSSFSWPAERQPQRQPCRLTSLQLFRNDDASQSRQNLAEMCRVRFSDDLFEPLTRYSRRDQF